MRVCRECNIPKDMTEFSRLRYKKGSLVIYNRRICKPCLSKQNYQKDLNNKLNRGSKKIKTCIMCDLLFTIVPTEKDFCVVCKEK